MTTCFNCGKEFNRIADAPNYCSPKCAADFYGPGGVAPERVAASDYEPIEAGEAIPYDGSKAERDRIAAALVGQQKQEGGWKQDAGKARMDLIAPEMMVAMANVLTFGAAKYDERNWEKGMSWGRCFGALTRHLWAWWAGEKSDPETGMSHLHHAACCLMFLIAYEERKIGTDDRKLPVDNLS